MLTSVDIHYLVGILCHASTSPDDVEIILGDMVYNEASQSDRDVDITITYKDENGNTNAFLGYEVKDHSRPLDSADIEQLCAKLKTHKSITKGHIVSSSGYTGPAKKVAEYNNIDLYHLKKWEDQWNEFDHVKFIPDLRVSELRYKWAQPPLVLIGTSVIIPDEDRKYISDDCQIYDRDENPIEGLTLLKFQEYIANSSLLTTNSHPDLEGMEIGEMKNVDINCDIKDAGKILLNKTYYSIWGGKVKGTIIKKERQFIPEYKILVDINDDKKRVGCLITDSSMGHLLGVAITEHNRSFQVIGIPVADRLKKKIFRQKLA